MIHNNVMPQGAYQPPLDTYQLAMYGNLPGPVQIQMPPQSFQYIPEGNTAYCHPHQVNHMGFGYPPPSIIPHSQGSFGAYPHTQGMPTYPGPYGHQMLTHMPASQSGYFAPLPDLVASSSQASSTTCYSGIEEMSSMVLRRPGIKRRAPEAIELITTQPAKVRVDEARMAACMNGLDINKMTTATAADGGSCDYTRGCDFVASQQHADSSQSSSWFCMEDELIEPTQVSMDLAAETTDNMTPRPQRQQTRGILDLLREGGTLQVRDEFKVDFKSVEILPKSVVDEIVKPGLQLVLWKPPGGNILGEIKKHLDKGEETTGSDTQSDEEEGDKNEPKVQDANLDPFADELMGDDTACQTATSSTCPFNDYDDMDL